MAIVQLLDAVSFTSALVNSADWKLVNDAVTTSSSSTVTSATASFTQNDVGKKFSIGGAVSGGRDPLVGTISTVTNGTTIVSSVAAGVSLTGASLMYGGRSEDPRHPLWAVTEAVLQKDMEICHEILKNPNHPRRNFFTFSANTPRSQTNTGLPVVNHSGELLMVEIKHSDNTWRVGKYVPPVFLPKLLTWLNNRSSLFSTASQGYYTILNNQLYFTGSQIRETFADLALNHQACQAPQEYTGAVCALAAALLFTTEGDDLQAAQILDQFGMSGGAKMIGQQTQ